VRIGLVDPNLLTYDRAQTSSMTITPAFLKRTLDSGTAVNLQASATTSPSRERHQFECRRRRRRAVPLGRAQPPGERQHYHRQRRDQPHRQRFRPRRAAPTGQRDPGTATLTMASGTTLSAGNGNITVALGIGSGTDKTSGNIAVDNLTTTGNVLIVNNGPTAGSSIVRAQASSLISANSVALDVNGAGGGGRVGDSANPLRVSVNNLTARSYSGGAYITSPTLGLTLGGAALGGLTGITTSSNGDVTISAAGSLSQSELIAIGSGHLTLTSGNNLSLDSITAGQILGQAVNDVTLNGSVSASGAGNALTLVAGGKFVNNAGVGAFSTPAGRWLVYSTDPSLDNRGSLAYDFKQYNATYGVTSVLGSGNGFLYTIAPTITVGLKGTTTKSYDGTTSAALTSFNYTRNGAIDGDATTLNNPALGTYADKNAGSGKQVTATGHDDRREQFEQWHSDRLWLPARQQHGSRQYRQDRRQGLYDPGRRPHDLERATHRRRQRHCGEPQLRQQERRQQQQDRHA
jgi:hypothetical protein